MYNHQTNVFILVIKPNHQLLFVIGKTTDNLMIWINPLEVLYQFGENGCLCILYDHDSTEPWSHKTLLNKPDKKTVKNNQIKPLVVKEDKKKTHWKK
jgi:hypothetical protein